MNVNFWISPDDANQEPESGGLIVHTRTAPLSWDFQNFNDDETAIRNFLPWERMNRSPWRIGKIAW